MRARPARAATPASCVMSTTVRPAAESAWNVRMTASPVAKSRLPVASGLVGRVAARAATRGVSLSASVAPGTVVACAEGDLSAVLGELVANAVKYADEGGSVAVSAARRGRRVAVSVSNTGPGIAPADVPRVFDRLWRGDAARTRGSGAEGYGLGLSIARRRAEALGGSISCESDPGRLTTVSFELPAR